MSIYALEGQRKQDCVSVRAAHNRVLQQREYIETLIGQLGV